MAAIKKEEVSLFQKHLKETAGKDSVAFQVFEYFKGFYPAFTDEKKLDLDYASGKIFKSETQSAAHKRINLQNALSDLNLTLKDFLILDRAAKNDFINRTLWISILKERGFKKECSREVKELFDVATQKEKSHADHYIEYMAAVYMQFEELSLETGDPDIQNMQHCLDELRIYGQTVFMKLACTMANTKKIRPGKTIVKPEEKISGEAHHAPKPSGLLLRQIYKNIYQLIHTEKKSTYDWIEQTMHENLDRIHPDELGGILTYLNNFLTQKTRTDKNGPWAEKMHQLHGFMLDLGLFDAKDAMPPTQFLNIINSAVIFKKFEWIETFMEKYGPRFEKNIVLLGQAMVLFEQGEFEQVNDLIRELDYKHPQIQLRWRILMLRSYMERQFNENVTMACCNAFESMLSRKDQKSAFSPAALEFVRTCKMILMRKTKPDKLKERIRSSASILLSDWLLAQVDKYHNL